MPIALWPVFIFGVFLGLFIALLWALRISSGTIHIYKNAEKDLYRLNLNDLDSLSSKNYILLRVDSVDLSHK